MPIANHGKNPFVFERDELIDEATGAIIQIDLLPRVNDDIDGGKVFPPQAVEPGRSVR